MKILTTLFSILFIATLCPAQIVVLEDDFESYTTGSLPDTLWVTRFDGNTAQISEEVSVSGLKSFKLVSNSSWARVEAVPLDTVYDYMMYEGWVYVDRTDRGGYIGFGFKESSSTYRPRNAIAFTNQGTIYFGGIHFQPYIAQTWYKVGLYCDFVRNMGKVFVNDILMGEEFPLSPRDVLVDFMISGTNFSGSGTGTLYFDDVKLYVPEFKILAITDVPNDQGRHVRLIWNAHRYDDIVPFDSLLVTEYSIWRKIDFNLNLHKSATSNQYWDYVTSIPAVQDWIYSAVVPTLADSNINGIYNTVYCVRAHTADPLLHWAAAPDSGYSLDNLAPSEVLGISIENIEDREVKLSWEESQDKDFSHFNIYRGNEDGFIPQDPIAQTAQLSYTDDTIEPGTYYYTISAVDFNGNEGIFSEYVSVVITSLDESQLVVHNYFLAQNYPNPFNPSTTIKYALKKNVHVSLKIYDMLGNCVAILVDEKQKTGWHEIQFDAKTMASGIYIYKLTAGDFVKNHKMVIIK